METIWPSSPPSNFEMDMSVLESTGHACVDGESICSDDIPDTKSSEAAASANPTTSIEHLVTSQSSIDHDDGLPFLVASGSSSSVVSTIVADSWEQADAVVETILLSHHATGTVPSGAVNARWSGPLSWLCAPLDFLPTCRADPSITMTSTGCSSDRRVQLHTDFKQAFQATEVIPFMANPCGGGSRGHAPEDLARRWNGHLPLDPVPDFYYQYPCLRDKRRHRIPAAILSTEDTAEEKSYDSYDADNSLFAPSLSIDEPDEFVTFNSSLSLVCDVIFSPLFVFITHPLIFCH